MLFGHSDKVKIFENLLASGSLGHAYLFFGDDQIGKFHFAKLLAYHLEFGKFEMLSETLIDTAIFGPDEKGTIGIDVVRGIKSFLWQTPLQSKRRLVIINNAEALTDEAQGSLLKVVEEPPVHGTVIFVAHDAQVLFPPLLSRLAKVYFSRLPRIEMERVLAENFKISGEKAKSLSAKSFGRIGRAIDIINGKIEEATLERDLEDKIVELWAKDKVGNARKLSWLIDRESLIKRLNLNQNLQRKSIEYKLYHG